MTGVQTCALPIYLKMFENETHIIVTIKHLEIKDDGSYECGDDQVQIRVLDPGKCARIIMLYCYFTQTL